MDDGLLALSFQVVGYVDRWHSCVAGELSRKFRVDGSKLKKNQTSWTDGSGNECEPKFAGFSSCIIMFRSCELPIMIKIILL